MEARIQPKGETLAYPLNPENINKAFKAVGIFQKLYEPPTEADFEYILRKKLTVLQWRLLCLFKKMFDDELDICREESEASGLKCKVHKAGLGFRKKMLMNSAIAETVFSTWAERLDIKAIYEQLRKHRSMNEFFEFESWVYDNEYDDIKVVEEDDFEETSIVSTSGLDVYERFYSVLRHLTISE